MQLLRSDEQKFSARPGEILLLFLLLSVTILYSVPPWRSFFLTGLADHWDPRLMGEWMAWNAHNILNGHIFLPDFNANFFYPHDYTLAFGELLWPESFLYALVYGLSRNLFLSFNLTMLFFWALSGITMYCLLRELRATRAVSYFGAFVFCLIPYRWQYYVEFNMVLVFIIPLLILLWIRWLKRPNLPNALWFVTGFWIAATSCLYFTLMAAITLGFLSIPYIVNHRDLLANRSFWYSFAVLGGGVLLLSGIYLYPYILLRVEGGYTRTSLDYLKHHAQAMHYLDLRSSALLNKVILTPPTRTTETYLFPGTVLSLVTIVFYTNRLVRFWRQLQILSAINILVAAAKFILWLIFWSTIIAHAFWGRDVWLSCFDHWLYLISLGLIGLYVIGLVTLKSNNDTTLFIASLAGAAMLCFFISLGPLITVGPDTVRLDLAKGPFADFARWIPIFGAVRGLTRFGIVVLIYLIVAGCLTLDKLIRQEQRMVILLPILICLMFYEASWMHYRYADYSYVMKSKVIDRIHHLPKDSVLVQLPAAERTVDATIAMATIENFPLLINGCSGFIPEEFQRLYEWEKKDWQLNKITNWLSGIWPEVYLILDKHATHWLATGWRQPFPLQQLEQQWQRIAQDDFYSLYRLKDHIDKKIPVTRRVRTDLLQTHPVLFFSARLADTTHPRLSVGVFLNGTEVDEEEITGKWHNYKVSLPSRLMGHLSGEEIKLKPLTDTKMLAKNDNKWEVKGMHFVTVR